MNFFDFGFVFLLMAAMIWGYRNGSFKTAIKLGFIATPSIALAYFGSDIAGLGNKIAAMLTDRVSAPLGLIGAGSGLIGMVGMVGAFFFGSHIILAIMDLHEPGETDKRVGAVMGALGVLGLALPIFIFTLKTFPDPSLRLLNGAALWPHIRPGVVAVHAPIDRFIDRRMAGLVNGLSDNDFIARIALRGDSDGNMLGGLVDKMKKIDMQEVFRLQKAARRLDPQQVEKLLTAYKSGDMSRERLKSQLENPNFENLK